MNMLDDWLPADGLTLEPNALRAAKEQAQCLAVVAGPGAGKTEMLAQRADFLLRTRYCRYPKRTTVPKQLEQYQLVRELRFQ